MGRAPGQRVGGDGRYNSGDPSISTLLREYDRRLRRLESGQNSGNTSVDTGNFTIGNGSFRVGPVPTVYFGPVSGSWGWIFQKDDGTQVFNLQGSPGNQYWAFFDDQGHTILSDDTVSGFGLAHPYLPVPCYPHYNGTGPNPYMTTTSGTFGGAWITRVKAQQPYIVFVVLCRCTNDGTTQGEVTLRDNNNGVSITAVPLGVNFFARVTLGPYSLANNFSYLEEAEFEIQIRRTAGAGTISVLMLNAYQHQS
jgi:hypothetical protein